MTDPVNPGTPAASASIGTTRPATPTGITEATSHPRIDAQAQESGSQTKIDPNAPPSLGNRPITRAVRQVRLAKVGDEQQNKEIMAFYERVPIQALAQRIGVDPNYTEHRRDNLIENARQNMLPKEGKELLLYHDPADGQLRGVGQLDVKAGEIAILVDPGKPKQGIGTQLMGGCIDRGKELRVSEFVVKLSSASSEAATYVAAKFGFMPDDLFGGRETTWKLHLPSARL